MCKKLMAAYQTIRVTEYITHHMECNNINASGTTLFVHATVGFHWTNEWNVRIRRCVWLPTRTGPGEECRALSLAIYRRGKRSTFNSATLIQLL